MEFNFYSLLICKKGGNTIYNQFVLNVDLKRLYTADTPKFRRGDSVVILFNFYDDGEEFDINSATKAQVHQKTSKGNIIVTDCTFAYHNGKRVVRFEVEDVAMVEFGYLNLLLTVYSSNDVISIQPFNVLVYDDYMGRASSFIELIQELQKLIENMVIDLNYAIKLTEKGQPNGVATLDEDGKIPLPQMPKEFQGFIDHITQTVYEHRVHGFSIDEDGMGIYETPTGDWQYIGFSPDGKGNGATQLVEAAIEVKDGKATVTYSGIPTVVSNKWSTGDRETTYFTLNGTSFTGSTFNVSALGIHTLYYKDSNGTEYVKTFNVTADMFNKPDIDITVDDGYVTITPPPFPTLSIKKWDKGSRDVAYFKYNGTTFTGNTFKVEEIGMYTVYVKTSGGLEYVYVFEVTQDMLPIIDNTPPVIKLIKSTESPTKNNVTVKINVTDESAIKTQKYFIGNANEQDTIDKGVTNTGNTLTFTQNNYLCVYAEDIHGNKVFEKHYIDNIDKYEPTVKYDDVYNGTNSTLTIKVSDGHSGIDYLQLPNGIKVTPTGSKYSMEYKYTTSTVGNHTFKVADKAGNIKTFIAKARGKIVKVASTSSLRMVLYENKEVYVTSSSKLLNGTGNGYESYEKDRKNNLLDINNVIDIATDGFNCYLVTGNGYAYVCGTTNNSGQFGLGHRNETTSYTRIPNITGAKSIVAFNQTRTLINTSSGWYASGFDWGSFGNGNDNSTMTFVKIGKPSATTSVSKYFFSCLSTYYLGSNNKLYASGQNENGMLGKVRSSYLETTPIESTLVNSLGTVNEVYASQADAYFKMTNGDIYYIGKYSQNTATKVSGFPTSGIVSTATVRSNSSGSGIAVATSDSIYVTGRNDYGLLGTGSETATGNPTTVVKVSGTPSNIVAFSSTGEHYEQFYEFYTSDNKLYVFGKYSPPSANGGAAIIPVTEITSEIEFKDIVPD